MRERERLSIKICMYVHEKYIKNKKAIVNQGLVRGEQVVRGVGL